MKISYVLNDKDLARFNLYKNLTCKEITRKKTLVRWIVCLMLLSTLAVLRHKNLITIGIVLMLCGIWIIISNSFMNYILQKQYNRHKTNMEYETIRITAQSDFLIINKGKCVQKYAYEEINHFFYFSKLLLLTLKSGESVLIPKRAFMKKRLYKKFYIYVLSLCMNY